MTTVVVELTLSAGDRLRTDEKPISVLFRVYPPAGVLD